MVVEASETVVEVLVIETVVEDFVQGNVVVKAVDTVVEHFVLEIVVAESTDEEEAVFETTDTDDPTFLTFVIKPKFLLLT